MVVNKRLQDAIESLKEYAYVFGHGELGSKLHEVLAAYDEQAEGEKSPKFNLGQRVVVPQLDGKIDLRWSAKDSFTVAEIKNMQEKNEMNNETDESSCELCQDTGWVCQTHDTKAWDIECDCSPGIMCVCNDLDENGCPKKSGFATDINEAN